MNPAPTQAISADTVLDYDRLVQEYSANLDVTLRGFRPAAEMLDTWVPDEDPVRSLSSLVEAAQLCGSDSVCVRVSSGTLGTDSAPSLAEKLGSLGEVTFRQEPDAVVLTVNQLQHTAAFRSVRPVYQHRLRARSAALRFNRPLRLRENDVVLRATEDGFSLALAVQPGDVIADAVFEGPIGGPMPGVLDCLCEILTNLPIQEARDHAVVRVEYALRDPQQRHFVSGIVLPQNADPIFRLPSALINRLFSDYQTSTGYREQANFFDPGPSPAWAALSPDQRKERVTAALTAAAPALGLRAGDAQVVDCHHAYAATVRFGDDLPIPQKRVLALALERVLREYCDRRLEVFCEEKKDLSKLRRLS